MELLTAQLTKHHHMMIHTWYHHQTLVASTLVHVLLGIITKPVFFLIFQKLLYLLVTKHWDLPGPILAANTPSALKAHLKHGGTCPLGWVYQPPQSGFFCPTQNLGPGPVKLGGMGMDHHALLFKSRGDVANQPTRVMWAAAESPCATSL